MVEHNNQQADVPRKRSAESREDGSPEAKKHKPKMDDFVLPCKVDDCVHVVVNVGTPPVKFTLCKVRIQHESDYFAAALNNNSKFEEGQNLTINLEDTCPEMFLLYIKTIFPKCAEDYQALPMFVHGDADDSIRPTLSSLIGLFGCIDRFGSISCANIQQRVLKSLRLLRETSTAGQWSQTDKMRLVTKFSKYNMDQDKEILDELLRHDLEVSDAKIMNDIKPTILYPIMEKNMAKLTRKINKLERVLDSSKTVELYCEDCNKVISLSNVAKDDRNTEGITCPYGGCNDNITIRKKKYNA